MLEHLKMHSTLKERIFKLVDLHFVCDGICGNRNIQQSVRRLFVGTNDMPM